ncbi:MAG: hypothetical protein AAF517_22530, partial [Planctomycetota bacterium]
SWIMRSFDIEFPSPITLRTLNGETLTDARPKGRVFFERTSFQSQFGELNLWFLELEFPHYGDDWVYRGWLNAERFFPKHGQAVETSSGDFVDRIGEVEDCLDSTRKVDSLS